MVQNNLLADKSTDFGVRMIKLHQYLCKEKKEFILSKQIYRSGTSIGANIREAKYAHGKADFVAKLQIALKECYETDYWLSLLKDTNNLSEKSFNNLYAQCSKLRRLLVASITTAKKNSEKQ